MKQRVEIHKTYKLYIGGKFVRSEGGRAVAAWDTDERYLHNVPQATRKDFRDAVRAAQSAQGAWAKKTNYLRSQIFYRVAEMIEARREEMENIIRRSCNVSPQKAKEEVDSAVDIFIHYAGWCDKYVQVLGSVNPVASSHFNFTIPEPVGVVSVMAPELPSFSAIAELIAPVILSGNSVVLLLSEKHPLPGLSFSEILATSDIPSGVVNILSSNHLELAPHIASHMGVHAIVNGCLGKDITKILKGGRAINLKRYVSHPIKKIPKAVKGATQHIEGTVEYKTVWHPIGL